MGFFSSPVAPLTEKNLPDQAGKVFIVTGSTSGVGRDLAEILYGHNAKIYLAARNAEKAKQTIESIRQKHPASSGALVFLHLDLNDLTTIKASANEFLSKEDRLDVLWNNAGVMIPPLGSVTKQNYDLQLGTNNIAPFLFTKLLTPLLLRTCSTAASAGAVRVVWVSSSAAKRFSPHGGVELDKLDFRENQGNWHRYGTSKAGNILHAAEMARLYGDQGLISTSLDPGILKTDLYKDMPAIQRFLVNLVLKDPIYGAYVELYAAFSPDITLANNGAFVEPLGNIVSPRADIAESAKTEAQGGSGIGEKYWKWCDEQVTPYL